jgi:GT2 family glycosyltransferase
VSAIKDGLFSIIVPVKAYNDYCRESLGTCRRLYPSQELLFSPDAPTEVPFEGVRVIPSGAVGPSVKRDLCAAQASGEILAFLDDDAYPAEGWLEAAAEIFSDPAVAGLGGPAVTPPHDSVARWASGLVYASMLAGGPHAYRYMPLPAREVDDYPTCNLLVRKSVMREIGGFGTEFWPGEDTVACLKITHQLKKRMVYDPRVLVYHHRRDVYRGHLRQVNSYALHRGYFVRKFPETSRRLSYFVPSLFLAGVALGWVPALWLSAWGWLWLGGLGLYLALVLLESLRMGATAPAPKRGPGLFWLTASGIVVTHLSYGWHFLRGLTALRLHEEKGPAAA